ncbi:SAM-dependent methyltransferase [Neobacillus piezotolerans]|uniref:SAM-dependent methyltransferase n=1 Tax=Neobacillus piezotolerans TaxID=2259171 RepID=A0A3D8GL15_9BACI|nr:SAM-dependent methyltransferase [Neobacillus piezotolerans]RDU35123.1 SAM-dependent methyltransferase [Neobacillus piezotolerans]
MLAYLKEVIEKSQNGLISYADYIGMALYHPVDGYYMRDSEKIGRSGDFITSSNVSDIFGGIFSKWFARLVEVHGLVPAVCEIGGGNGRFAKAFIEEWKNHSNENLAYTIIEASPFHQKLQRETLDGFSGFSQAVGIDSIRQFKGLVFSNELFDALPVHVVENHQGTLMEAMVGIAGGRLYEKLVPLENAKIYSFLEDNGFALKEGQRIEVPLAMEEMVKAISIALDEGIVATVDYGYTTEEWMMPERRSGSLRGYKNHQMMDDILENPGTMDITSHIHFDALAKAGENNGLETLLKLRQDEFLLSAGILAELEEHYDPNPFSERSRRNRAIRSLVLPSGMSPSFHVLIQQKGRKLNSGSIFP